MKVEYVDVSEMPQPKNAGFKNRQQLIDVIENLPDDKAVKITPDKGKSIRGLKVSVGRIASARNIEIQTETSEDGKILYVKKSN